ncbi:exosome complex exonuclease RRP6 [Pseudohyphozyma bogoriensis]|nr:exosome complex exonuclease RRP6 [Pseudohyphozyma bogoriensis]
MDGTPEAPALPLGTLLANLEASLLPLNTSAAQLPSASDLGFERSLSRPLARALTTESERIYSLVTTLLRWVDPEKSAKYDVDGEMVQDGVYGDVVERIEGLLEGADEAIEESLGVGKASRGVGAVGAKQGGTEGGRKKDRLAPNLLNADVPKPQLSFPPRLLLPRSPLPDGEPPLWKPILRTKLHAADPSAGSSSDSWLTTELYTPPAPKSSSTLPAFAIPQPRLRYAHPYAAELATLTPPEHFLLPPATPAEIPEDSFDKTPYEWIGDLEAFKRCVEEVREAGKEGKRELAVDLEHHDTRTWGGVTCLMQMSTRNKDYVIDVLVPEIRDHLEELNEFFADPTWIKVFHGSHSDIIWLQRDFGLYVVGLFDTYHATHVLNFPHHSLASLLEMYTSFTPDKRYQLADWRVRPIPKEMLHYARADTHYLLTIYDHLRLALHNLPPANPENPSLTPLNDVFVRSVATSSSVFEILPYDSVHGTSDSGWRGLLSKWRHLSSYDSAVLMPILPIKSGWGPGELRLELLRAVHAWREDVAREEDESWNYVMGNDVLLRIVESAPRSEEEWLGVVRGVRSVGEVTRRRKAEVLAIVKKVVAQFGGKMGASGDEGVSGVAGVVRTNAVTGVEEPEVRPLRENLWGEPSSSSSIAAKAEKVVRAGSSTLFGKGKHVEVSTSESLVASTSSFFGKKVAVKAARSVESREDAVKRVHESLALGGGLADTLKPQVIPVVAVPLAEETQDAIMFDDPAPQPDSHDHAYVPLTGRIPKPSTSSNIISSAGPAAPTPKDTDVLVVSELKDKPKKRRRAKTETEGAVEAEGGAVTEGGDKKLKKKKKEKGGVGATEKVKEEVVPYDYSTHKSILDADPNAAVVAQKPKKEKKKKGEVGGKGGFEIDNSEFGKQPRAKTSSNKGNFSQSFAK